ncbi:MAG TPA: LysR substrate-binding domain-containing protein [Caulobacteraceae bacterium]|nr:LysR substrate-binding domain-containing protein [Caulobacteraceae bacterium]
MAETGPPFAALRFLEAAARLRGYSAAGASLGVTHSAVSQAVRRLERLYGRVLFRRRGMQMAPTAAALALADAYREAERIMARAEGRIRTADAPPALVVSTLPSIAKLWLSSRLERLRDALPDIGVEVRTGRELANLKTDGVDVALRIGPGGWPGVRAELLFEEYVFPVCSPEFLTRNKARVDAGLAGLPLIREDVDLWPLWFAAAGLRPQPAGAGPTFDDSSRTVDAAAAGLGVALARRLHAQEALAAGRLVRISPISVRDPYSCYLVWREDNPRIAAIRRFADWVLAECDSAGLLKAA